MPEETRGFSEAGSGHSSFGGDHTSSLDDRCGLQATRGYATCHGIIGLNPSGHWRSSAASNSACLPR